MISIPVRAMILLVLRPVTEERAALTARTFAPARPSAFSTILFALLLFAASGILSGQQAKPTSSVVTKPVDATAAARRRFLDMFVRAYVPGRSGQLLIVPREGEFLTRPDPDLAYMH